MLTIIRGTRLAAAPDAPPSHSDLEAFCRERLAAYKRPRTLHFVAALPRNAMGKVQKHELRATIG